MAVKSVSIFSFNVGFGDCFLIRLVYSDSVSKHVLIDFGTTRLPEGAEKDRMLNIAKEIKALCGGKLELVVATHRHRDHISGFATNEAGDGIGNIIASLSPDYVVQPWTEDPDLPTDAKDPSGMRGSAASLRNMNAFAGSVKRFADGLDDKTMSYYGISMRERDFLSFMGDNNLPNKSAVDNLIAMGGPDKSKAKYLHAGSDFKVPAILPGVKIQVLGPPTVKQLPDVARQRARNNDQYWNLMAFGQPLDDEPVDKQVEAPLFPNHDVPIQPHAKWVRWRLNLLRKEMLLPIVRALDQAMNNTSLILLFEVGKKLFLFPGDAQWENWQYALDPKNGWVDMLGQVDVYKVGHHGSLNATPMTLWRGFDKRGGEDKQGRLTAFMSTMAGVHGEKEGTAVPRATLVDALKKETNLHTTQDSKDLYQEVSFSV